MEQKPSIDSIKKFWQYFWTLSLQETDDAVGVKEKYCSTFMSSNGLLAQGEIYNPKSDERNALVTLLDPKTAEDKVRLLYFLLSSLQSLFCSLHSFLYSLHSLLCSLQSLLVLVRSVTP